MSSSPRELALAELEAGLDLIRASPRDAGTIEMIVRRSAGDVRVGEAIRKLAPSV